MEGGEAGDAAQVAGEDDVDALTGLAEEVAGGVIGVVAAPYQREYP